jgi:hypothetical protein
MTLANCTLIARRLLDLLIGRFQCGHSDLFRSVRYLGFAAARCTHPSGEIQGRSSVWLPAWLPSAGQHHALVLVTTIGLVPGAVTAPCRAQTSPPNPIAAEPYGRRVLSGGGVADHAVTPQAPLTGSGCREHSYGGFGGGHPHFHPHAVFRKLQLIVSREYVTACPAALLPGLSAAIPPWHPRSSRLYPGRSQPRTRLMAPPAVRFFRRGKSRERGLFGGGLSPVSSWAPHGVVAALCCCAKSNAQTPV